VVRQVRFREPQLFMQRALAGQGVAQSQEVSRADLAFEFMLNALRLKDGFDLQLFAERTGLALSAVAPALEQAEQRGLLERDLSRVRPSLRGYDFLNDLQALFLPPRSA
jgi:oxygen-independent coproporphyrinogen-3 oxidase